MSYTILKTMLFNESSTCDQKEFYIMYREGHQRPNRNTGGEHAKANIGE